ncbi:MAG: UbiD family decarboxylase, partial [Gemmobacter sp.]|uniref:UbiD family decarboxylase n=1 Tax=Gemmobacter sp. TaxID=1898957 RepID=UPI001A631AEB
MRRPEGVKGGAACDLRAALATCEGVLRLEGFGPDAAAAELAAHHIGPPARPRAGPEPVVLFPQAQGPALCFGLYGDEVRLRGWLPGLPQRIAPDTLAGFAPVAPVWEAASNHLPMPPDLTALPVPQVTPRDAGRYLSMGFLLAEVGAQVAVSAHRMLVLGPDRLGLWMLPGRALRQMAEAAHAGGRDLPVTVNIGVPPALAIASATSTSHLPAPLDKLALAGGLAQAPLALARTAEGLAYLARSEIVLEGVITAEQVPEALPGAPLAGSMP